MGLKVSDSWCSHARDASLHHPAPFVGDHGSHPALVGILGLRLRLAEHTAHVDVVGPVGHAGLMGCRPAPHGIASFSASWILVKFLSVMPQPGARR